MPSLEPIADGDQYTDTTGSQTVFFSPVDWTDTCMPSALIDHGYQGMVPDFDEIEDLVYHNTNDFPETR
jgi:hypothetical protein